MATPEDTPVVILCGGRGMRLQERTHAIPKPLVEIGGRPIVWHVVRLYAHFGFRRFVLATGYLGEQVRDWAAGEAWPAGVTVECVGTGAGTPTGGRVAALADRLAGGTFCVTYADGVADVDLREVLRFHEAHDGAATMTVVRPALPFGVTRLDGDAVVGFEEKPRAEHWINGGFLVFEPEVLALLDEEATLEREPLEALSADGRLRAFRHDGFWDCMDTYKDQVVLDDLLGRGEAPWVLWR